MELKLWNLFVILCIAKVCHGQLMCYVCENCLEVTSETPQFECNEDFFNAGGLTDSSVQTTTELPKTTEVIGMSTTTEITTTTTAAATTTTPASTTPPTTTTPPATTTTAATTTTTEAMKTTMETTRANTIITESTTKAKIDVTTDAVNKTVEDEGIKETTPVATKMTPTATAATTTTITTKLLPASPPTTQPPINTTALPTSPNFSTMMTLIDNVEKMNNQTEARDQQMNEDEMDDFMDNDDNYDMAVTEAQYVTAKVYKPSAEFRIRQLRSVSEVSYHCFKVLATTANGTMVVNRGCSSVKTTESVCDQWKQQHPTEQMNKCYPCSRTKCNGSSALNVSITALFVAVAAVVMRW